MPTTAAALIIGNEILTGKIQETNLALLARELFGLGIEMRRVVICRDEVATICSELGELRRQHDYVITSGGVGPTHDDVTLAAVARCFGRPLERSAELESMIRERVGERCTEAHLRMADVPAGAELLSSLEVRWPTVVMGNVFVMPGLPEIFRMKLPALRERLSAAGSSPFLSRTVYTRCQETDLADILDRLANDHAAVSIGSYPVLGNESYRVKLTFDGTDQRAIDDAVDSLLGSVPADKIVEG